MTTENKPTILNLSVQLDNFWVREDGDLSDALKDAVVSELIGKLLVEVREQFNQLIKTEFLDKMKDHIQPAIDTRLKELIETGEITRNDKKVNLVEHLENLFYRHSSWNNYEDHVNRLAKGWADDLKKRYDMVFANHLVQKLNENGLLLPDVAKRLLDQ